MWVLSLGWKIPWRRRWQPTPVFLPGESLGQRSLADYSLPRGHKESDMTEQLTHICTHTHAIIIIGFTYHIVNDLRILGKNIRILVTWKIIKYYQNISNSVLVTNIRILVTQKNNRTLVLLLQGQPTDSYLFCFHSLGFTVLHCQVVSVLQTVVSYIMYIFSCFWQENKCGPWYSILARS